MPRDSSRLALIGLIAVARPGVGQTPADSASVTAAHAEWLGALRQGPERFAALHAEGGMLPPGLPYRMGSDNR